MKRGLCKRGSGDGRGIASPLMSPGVMFCFVHVGSSSRMMRAWRHGGGDGVGVGEEEEE